MSSVRGGTRLKRGKGRKSRIGGKTPGLSQEDIEFLIKNTKYDEAEIKEWYKGFKVSIIKPKGKGVCGDGLVHVHRLSKYKQIE